LHCDFHVLFHDNDNNDRPPAAPFFNCLFTGLSLFQVLSDFTVRQHVVRMMLMPFLHLIPETIPVADQAEVFYPISLQLSRISIPADGAAGIPFAWLDFHLAHQYLPTPEQLNIRSVIAVITDPEKVRKTLHHLVKFGPGRAADLVRGWAPAGIPA
jgi:hypothetical protein